MAKLDGKIAPAAAFAATWLAPPLQGYKLSYRTGAIYIRKAGSRMRRMPAFHINRSIVDRELLHTRRKKINRTRF